MIEKLSTKNAKACAELAHQLWPDADVAEHAADLMEIDEDDLARCTALAKQIARRAIDRLDADGATLWSSADALDPTRTWEPWGIDAGDLDGDGDVDLVFSIDRNDPPEPFHVLWNTTAGGGAITFTDLDAGDLDPDRDMRLAELTWLGAP